MSHHILIIDDEKRHRELYANTLRKNNFRITLLPTANDALKFVYGQKHIPDMIISDVKMPGVDGLNFLKEIKKDFPDMPFLLITAYPEVKDAVKALKLGAVDYLEKPIDLDELVAAAQDNLGITITSSENELSPSLMKGIIAESGIVRSVFRDAFKAAASDAGILITGESGSGKEVLARFIHDVSPRAKGHFSAVNCAAMPRDILGSELFGHTKGAFTGALKERNGLFREADGGTVFLDEIGDMPLELQPSLLRVLETGKVSPLGSDKEYKTDFRFITSTNKNLREEVRKGNFRKDLYYRLNIIAFEMPPLKERPEDIIPLAKAFLKKSSSGKNKRFSQAAASVLANYSWPGNVRELANAVERATILSNTEIILPEHLPASVSTTGNAGPGQTGTVKTMDEAEKEAIKSALNETGGNRTKAAALLGISRRSLIYKLKRYDVN
jgi:two-component system response regulator HydG